MTIVLDASYALAIAFGEHAAKDAAHMTSQIANDGAIVPALWRWEFANGIGLALLRQRIDQFYAEQQFIEFSELPIAIDDISTDRAWTITMKLAERHRLTAYDAAYLELAARLDVPLATLDRKLASAARKEGVKVIPD